MAEETERAEMQGFATPTETHYREATVLVAERPGGKAIAIVDMTAGHAHVVTLPQEGADTVAEALRASGVHIAKPEDLAALEAPGR